MDAFQHLCTGAVCFTDVARRCLEEARCVVTHLWRTDVISVVLYRPQRRDKPRVLQHLAAGSGRRCALQVFCSTAEEGALPVCSSYGREKHCQTSRASHGREALPDNPFVVCPPIPSAAPNVTSLQWPPSGASYASTAEGGIIIEHSRCRQPVDGVLIPAPQKEVLQLVGYRDGRKRRVWVVRHAPDGSCRVEFRVRSFPCNELVEEAPHRPHVTGGARQLPAGLRARNSHGSHNAGLILPAE